MILSFIRISHELGRNAGLYSDNTLYHSASSFWLPSSKRLLQTMEAEERG